MSFISEDVKIEYFGVMERANSMFNEKLIELRGGKENIGKISRGKNKIVMGEII